LPCRLYQQQQLAGCWWSLIYTGLHPHPIALVLIRPVLLRSAPLGLSELTGQRVSNLFFLRGQQVFNLFF
ncbi:MAG: hypothetical protein K9G70_06505, partial [Prolixibacteraceae bacterium]|nr:hypothetical protein [Prolixibacteraceae bacterium]